MGTRCFCASSHFPPFTDLQGFNFSAQAPCNTTRGIITAVTVLQYSTNFSILGHQQTKHHSLADKEHRVTPTFALMHILKGFPRPHKTCELSVRTVLAVKLKSGITNPVPESPSQKTRTVQDSEDIEASIQKPQRLLDLTGAFVV